MTSIEEVERAARKTGNHVSGHRTSVIAVSGGVDSVVLASVVSRLLSRHLAPVLAHFTHLTRTPAEHERDLNTVRKLAARLGLPLYSGSQNEFSRQLEKAGGPESTAREARYRFLVEVCLACGASLLLTAHTLDDQIETLSMRLLAGIDSRLLAGIDELSYRGFVTVLRPFLGTRKSDIVEYARFHSLVWNEDRTNSENRFRRNLVRNLILPAARESWPSLDRDILLIRNEMSRRALAIRDRAYTFERTPLAGGLSVDAHSFFSSSDQVRLELLYSMILELGLLSRRDRPSHRFFAPLLGTGKRTPGTLVNGRGMRIFLSGSRLVIAPVLSGSDKLGIFEEQRRSLHSEGSP